MLIMKLCISIHAIPRCNYCQIMESFKTIGKSNKFRDSKIHHTEMQETSRAVTLVLVITTTSSQAFLFSVQSAMLNTRQPCYQINLPRYSQ